MSAGGSQSKQESISLSNSSSFISPDQLPFLQNLWQTASGMMGAGSQAGEATQNAANALMPQFGQLGNALMGMLDTSREINAQDASLRAGLQNVFQNDIMPGIESDSIAAGGIGGGRQGVAQGVAAGQIANAYQQGRGQIVSNANQRATQAAALFPSYAQSMIGTAQAPALAGFGPLAQIAQILGRPTVLSQSSSSSLGQGSSQSFDFGVGNLFG